MSSIESDQILEDLVRDLFLQDLLDIFELIFFWNINKSVTRTG